MNSKQLTAFVVALSLAAPPVLAQQTNAQKEPSVPALVESVEVRVINVDVVVTDRKGKPVTGLKKDDFDILENGRPVKVTNFYEVKNANAAAPSTVTTGPKTTGPAVGAEDVESQQDLRRRIVFFIDNLSLHPFNRNRVFTSMKKFVAETMRPGDEAMIATWNRSMKIRVPFTTDVTQIQQSLDGIAGESAFGLSNISERRSVEGQIRDAQSYSDALGAARQYSQSVEHDLRQSVEALNGLMATLAGVQGKKILVLTSEGFPLQPGREMFYFIDDIARQKSNWGAAGSSLLESMSFDSTPLIQSIARTANANSITLYTLHAGGLVGAGTNSAENQQPLSYVAQEAGLTNSTESLRLMADLTGGVATVGTNNFSGAFDKIESDLSSYYSLGYRAGTERVDRQRSVQVRMHNRNYIARSRKSFVEKSVDTEMSDRVIANLFYDQNSNDLKITVTTQQPLLTDDGLYKVPVEIHIPMESITLFPQGEVYAGGFTVFIAASDKNGDMSDVSRQEHQLRIPQSEIEKTKGKYYTYSAELLMNKGRNRISVGVVDEISKTTGFEKQEVLAADLR
ncbi:MAG: VWA domain-containing protein [Acidobacteriota bacterium]